MLHRNRHSSKGKFGTISITDTLDGDTPVCRELRINNQVQGGAFFSPSAMDDGWAGIEVAPGVVATSQYQAALLTLPAMFEGAGARDYRVAVAGLGAGTGMVQLRASCDNGRYTIFEIDPEISKVAKRWFPLTDRLFNFDSCELVEGDFREEVVKQPYHFDAMIMDAYRGTNDGYDIDDTLLDLIPSWWINCIDKLNGPVVEKISKQLIDRGLEVWRMPASDPAPGGMRNVLLIGVAPGFYDQTSLDAYVPCERVDKTRMFPLVENLRKHYWHAVAHAERVS